MPLGLREARAYVAKHHRHNEPPRGHKFSIGLARGGLLVGVVIVGRPVARALDDGRTAEIHRVTTEGDANACSRLYGAACRAAAAMGYRRAVTYSLASEPGTSLRAAGFSVDGAILPRPAHHHATGTGAGPRAVDRLRLFGPPLLASDVAKVRWVRYLGASSALHPPPRTVTLGT